MKPLKTLSKRLTALLLLAAFLTLALASCEA